MPTTRNRLQESGGNCTILNQPDVVELPTSFAAGDDAIEIKEELQEDVEGFNEGVELLPFVNSAKYISPENVTYEIIGKGSAKGTEKIYSSDGFSFALSKVGVTGFKTWRCVKRKSRFSCQAKLVSRKDGTFDTMGTNHSHPPHLVEYAQAKLKGILKRKALKHPKKSTTKMAKKLLAKHLPNAPEGVQAASVEMLAHAANRHRRKLLEKSKKRTLEIPATSEDGCETHTKVPFTTTTGFTKTRKRKRKQSTKDQKSRKKKSKIFEDAASASTMPDLHNPFFSGRPDALKDDYIAIFVPKKYFKKMFKGGFCSSDFPLASGANASPKPAETEVCNEYRLANGSRSSDCLAPTYAGSSGNHVSKSDPDEMFFRSIAAEVKDIPKPLKSTLKMEILASVNSVLQNLPASSGSHEQT